MNVLCSRVHRSISSELVSSEESGMLRSVQYGSPVRNMFRQRNPGDTSTLNEILFNQELYNNPLEKASTCIVI